MEKRGEHRGRFARGAAVTKGLLSFCGATEHMVRGNIVTGEAVKLEESPGGDAS